MDNRAIAEMVFKLQAAIRHKNGALARSLQGTILGLLRHPNPIHPGNKAALRSVKGVGPTTIEWIARILEGGSIEVIAADIPERKRYTNRRGTGSHTPDLGNWDGSWDNLIMAIESE